MNDGLKVLDILAHHPSTAHFISLRLAQRFVADDPPPALVNRMAETFLKTDGDLRKVVAAMIYSGEFWSAGSYRAKVKTPLEMVVSSVRATDADVTSAFLLANQVQRLGEPLYRKIEPTGYSSANAEWVSSASLLDRMNFAIALAHDHVPGVKVDIGAWQMISDKDPWRWLACCSIRIPVTRPKRPLVRCSPPKICKNNWRKTPRRVLQNWPVW